MKINRELNLQVMSAKTSTTTSTTNTTTTTSTSNNWELTQYEEQRKPHEVRFADTMVSRSLNQDFTCPICLELLKNTMAAKECLHRFCQVSSYKQISFNLCQIK